MNSESIVITRSPYEEPYHLNLRIAATNGRRAGELEYYCNAKDLTSLGSQLATYEGRMKDHIVYELGSEDPAARFAFHLRLEARPVNSRGDCMVGFRMSDNGEEGEREISEFSIQTAVPDLNRLGRLLVEFGKLRHRRLAWSNKGGELSEEEE